MISKDKKLIFIDIDDVIAKTSASVLDLAKELFNKDLKHEDLVSFDLEKTLNLSSSEMDVFFKELHNEDLLINTPLISDAKISLEKIKEMGYIIYLITGRLPSTYGVTKKWLKKNEINYDYLYFADKYSRYPEKKNESHILSMDKLSEINFTLAVEDSLIMARWFSKRKTKVALLDNPWNREKTGESIKRCHNWNEVLVYLQTL